MTPDTLPALRKAHRYFRSLAMADPYNRWLESVYRDLGAALASLTPRTTAPGSAVATHHN